MFYKNKDLISIRINENKFLNNSYSLKQIKRLSDKLSNYLLKKGIVGKMMTSVVYGQLN